MVLLAISPCLIKAWRDPQAVMITRWVAYAYTCGFLFGWHVHEKASLHFVIPLAIVAGQNLDNARHYFILSIGMILPHCHFFTEQLRGYFVSTNIPPKYSRCAATVCRKTTQPYSHTHAHVYIRVYFVQFEGFHEGSTIKPLFNDF
jgi:hypothetical protein